MQPPAARPTPAGSRSRWRSAPLGRPAAPRCRHQRQLAGRKPAPESRQSAGIAASSRSPASRSVLGGGPDPALPRRDRLYLRPHAPVGGPSAARIGRAQPPRVPITNPPMSRSAPPAACSAPGTVAHGRISALRAGSQLARPASTRLMTPCAGVFANAQGPPAAHPRPPVSSHRTGRGTKGLWRPPLQGVLVLGGWDPFLGLRLGPPSGMGPHSWKNFGSFWLGAFGRIMRRATRLPPGCGWRQPVARCGCSG